MYKCGWHGCEKAYGTLNHLNAHVTMQSHGAKRTPEGERSVYDVFAKSRIWLACHLHALVALHNVSLTLASRATPHADFE